jgi:hypothetical protein
MSVRLCGLVVTLIGGLAVAGCTSDAVLLGDATPLPPGSFPLPRPAPKLTAIPHFTAPKDAATWRHHPEPVSAQQFNQDKAKCTRIGNSAPGAGSPDMKFYIVFVDCMHSAGYEAGSNL